MLEIKSTFSFVHIIKRFADILYKRELQEVLYNPFLTDPLIKNLTQTMSEDQDSASFVNENYTKARINLLMGPTMSIRNLENGLTRISEIGAKHFGDMADLTVPGYPALFIKVMDYAFGSMKKSLFVAFLLIFISMWLMLRNLKLAFIAIIPNIFPIVLFLGFLGYSQINLDLTTSTVAAIVLGIAIDDTIHFLNRYLREENDSVDVISAVRKAHYHVGRIIVISSIILFLGFSILLFASIKTVFYFGLLIAFSVLVTLIGDLVMLPLILKISANFKTN
ncbi:MAG: MMPL family transporter [Candidatus Hodarchaeales archaeon]